MDEKLTFINNEINQIKIDGRSFLGIDGGNIRSKVWFCGIEFGGELKSMEDYLSSYVKKKSIDDFDLEIPYREESGGFEKSTYDRYLSLMYYYLFTNNQNKDDGVDQINSILNDTLYNLDSKIFKLNLFPLAKKSAGWDKQLELILGIEKSKYYREMFDLRKFFFHELLNKFQPELLICTSTKEYHSFFEETFIPTGEKMSFKWDYIQSGNIKHKISTYSINNLTVLIIPFLGRFNLSSYSDVKIVAEYIKDHYLT